MRFSIKAKLFLGFGLVLAVLVAMGFVSDHFLDQVTDANQEYEEAGEALTFFQEVDSAHLSWLNELSNVFALGEDFEGELDYTECTFGQWYYDYIESSEFEELPQDIQQEILDMEEPHRELHLSAENIVEIVNGEEDNEQALSIYQAETIPAAQQMSESIERLESFYQERQQNMLLQAEEYESIAETWSTLSIVLGVVGGIIIAFVIGRSVVSPLKLVTNRMKEIAEQGGDLTQQVEVNSRDEVRDLAENFNNFLENLKGILLQVRDVSDTVSTAANEISSGNQDLSQRTEEQASSLEEISSSIEEITTSLKHTTDKASEAEKISNASYEKVKEGEKVIGDMGSAMQNITNSSQEISEIINKVNEIAFQTNLLALNAAVEAARAGEQGKGFAVVAGEVRNLAGRASESAKEIEKLIKDSIDNVSEGNSLMEQTSGVLSEIVQNTERTVDIIGEISSSMKEQSSAVNEIKTGIDELNQVTQQNASMVEEIASSSESMQSEASGLNDLLSSFKLNGKSNTTKVLARKEGQQVNSYRSASNSSHKPAQRNTGGTQGGNKPEQIEGDALEDDFGLDDFEKF